MPEPIQTNHFDHSARDCFWSIFEHEVREGALHLEALERAARMTCKVFGIESRKVMEKGIKGDEKQGNDVEQEQGADPDPDGRRQPDVKTD